MPKQNAMLAKIEAKYAAEYAAKYAIAEANFNRMLDMAMQQMADAAIFAADDTFDVNEYSAEKFHVLLIHYVNKMSNMAVVEDKDDPEMWWTKATVDKRLLQIVGKDCFQPWDERYGIKEQEEETNIMQAIKISLDPGAKMPTRAHEADAGLDLYSMEANEIPPFGSTEFDTGTHISIPAGYVGFVKSKSGLMMKQNITTDGTVDSGYIGSIRVKLFNHGGDTVYIEKGQKIAQLVLLPIITPKMVTVDKLKDTERGCGGFGSTGKF